MDESKLINDNDLLKPRAGDAFPYLAQAILSALCPLIGFITGLLQEYIGTPAWRRAEEFLRQLDQRVVELEQTGLNKENLLQDQRFITIVINGLQMAVRTHQQEKLDALRNAILNSAFNSTDEDKELSFLQIINSLTAFDLKVLYLIYSQSIGMDRIPYGILKATFKSFNMNTEISIHSVKVLANNGLVTEELSFASEPIEIHRNNYGNEFIEFIKEPIIKTKESPPPDLP